MTDVESTVTELPEPLAEFVDIYPHHVNLVVALHRWYGEEWADDLAEALNWMEDQHTPGTDWFEHAFVDGDLLSIEYFAEPYVAELERQAAALRRLLERRADDRNYKRRVRTRERRVAAGLSPYQ